MIGRTAIISAPKQLAEKKRPKLLVDVGESFIKHDAAVAVDGGHLKFQIKQFYDVTSHFMEIKNKGLLDPV